MVGWAKRQAGIFLQSAVNGSHRHAAKHHRGLQYCFEIRYFRDKLAN
jgi:hypothetical protein